LYRPGTLENNVAFEYSKRKNGAKRWKSPHKSVDKFVDYTYGFMIFQEQVMQIYRELAKDATPAESALFMKVVSKGIARDLDGKKKLQKYRDKFVEGCVVKGIPESIYNTLWDQILQMSTYSFNKSHSAGYAIQAYQDAWLKHYYPLEFYSSLLTVEDGKIPEIIRESRGKGIKILPPDINISESGFTIDNNNIRFGLAGIKNIGPAVLDLIRNKRPFVSIVDMAEKCPKKILNKTRMKSLFYSGALDRFDARTKYIFDDEEGVLISGKLDETTLIEMEREYVGFSTSRSSDLETYKIILDDMVELNVEDKETGEEVVVGGEITNVKVIQTKKGDTMAFVTLDYFNHDFNLTIFPELYKKYNHMFGQGNALLAMGDWDSDRQCVTVNNICTAEQLAVELNGG
jgi:DNA polymerase-3 subunit alpha